MVIRDRALKPKCRKQAELVIRAREEWWPIESGA
jgi:hypothetical protein